MPPAHSVGSPKGQTETIITKSNSKIATMTEKSCDKCNIKQEKNRCRRFKRLK